MIGIQMPHHPSLAGLDRQKRNQLAQRWLIHVHLTVQFLSQSLIQFIAHAVYEGRAQKAQYDLEGIMCAECRNNAGRDKSNSARISSVSSVPSASVGPLPGRRFDRGRIRECAVVGRSRPACLALRDSPGLRSHSRQGPDSIRLADTDCARDDGSPRSFLRLQTSYFATPRTMRTSNRISVPPSER